MRRHAVHTLLYETHLPAEVILGAFSILDKVNDNFHVAQSSGSQPAHHLQLLQRASLMTAESTSALCNLMAAAFIAYKVYTTNCAPCLNDFFSNVLPDYLPHVKAVKDNIMRAEQDVLAAINWTVPTRTRFDCVLEVLAEMAEHTTVHCSAQDCTICNSPVENPYKLPCGHDCCRGCVATMTCHGFRRKHACPACCKGLPLLAYHHYSAIRTMMPLKLEIDRACAYSVLASPIKDCDLFARAVLWAAVYLMSERKVKARIPTWLPHLYNSEKNCPQHKVVMAGMDIATAYAKGKPGTLQLSKMPVPSLASKSKKRKFIAIV